MDGMYRDGEEYAEIENMQRGAGGRDMRRANYLGILNLEWNTVEYEEEIEWERVTPDIHRVCSWGKNKFNYTIWTFKLAK